MTPGRDQVRFLFSSDDIAAAGSRAKHCGACSHARDKRPEKKVAWCSHWRFMVGTTTPILCEAYQR